MIEPCFADQGNPKNHIATEANLLAILKRQNTKIQLSPNALRVVHRLAKLTGPSAAEIRGSIMLSNAVQR